MEQTQHSYKNPFAEYSANGLNPEAILDYWYDPFSFIPRSEFKEDDLFTDSNPIVFMGGRGSGKTMFLKYFSYEVQKLQIQRNKNLKREPLEELLTKKGVGFYLRIDGPKLRSFSKQGKEHHNSDALFTHYFELETARSYLEFFNDILEDEWLSEGDINPEFISKLAQKLGAELDINSIGALLEDVYKKLQEIEDYRGDSAFYNVKFNPTKSFASRTLSYEIPSLANKYIDGFEDVKFILLIDEYENFSDEQQRTINTLLKFVEPSINFRIGMKLEGFRTYETNTTDNFLKEGRDYRMVEFEEVLFKKKKRGYQNFLKGVAQKRLEKSKFFKEKDITDISKLLGIKEDLVQEAKDLVKNDPLKHFEHFDGLIPEDSIEYLRYEENPLMELLNILWILRDNTLVQTKKAMDEYLRGEKTAGAEKYRMDYTDKYKYALVFILAKIYKKDKLYYSFNTYSFLSSGIIGHFIELCRRCFQYAEFEAPDELFEEGLIPPKLQSQAALDFSLKELEMTKRIENYGNNIHQFTMNIGNIFKAYHYDELIRYPELNQFSVSTLKLDEKYQSAFKAAIMWSIVQKKQEKLQSSTPGKGKKKLYTLNRIFSPSFNISYRTRGGVSEEYDASDIKILMTRPDIKPQKDLDQRLNEKKFKQQRLDF